MMMHPTRDDNDVDTSLSSLSPLSTPRLDVPLTTIAPSKASLVLTTGCPERVAIRSKMLA
jgi:hypothetical protein